MADKKPIVKPTSKELEILQVLWKSGPSSVKEVHFALGGDPTNGYTTILKLMQIMLKKELVTRQKSGKMHRYRAVASQENTARHLVHKMIETVFDGSTAQLVLSALGHGKSSKDELNEIRKYLDKLEGGHS